MKSEICDLGSEIHLKFESKFNRWFRDGFWTKWYLAPVADESWSRDGAIQGSSFLKLLQTRHPWLADFSTSGPTSF